MAVSVRQGRRSEESRSEEESARAAAVYLQHVHQFDGALDGEARQIVAEEQRLESLQDLRDHHVALAKGLLSHARHQYSGSSRAWNIFEAKVYGRPFTAIETPRAVKGLALDDVERAMGETIQLRQAIDRPLLAKGMHVRRFAEVAVFLEASRLGSEEAARRLEGERRAGAEALSQRRAHFEGERRRMIEQLQAERERIDRTSAEARTTSLRNAATAAVDGIMSDSWWERTQTPSEVEPMLLGGLQVEASPTTHLPDEVRRLDVPWFRDLREIGNLVVPYNGAGPSALADGHLEQLTLRALTAFPPSTLRVAFVDPLGLGRADAKFLGLSDHDPDLVHRRVRSSREDIEELLKELVAHIESVTQKYLRGSYASIDEYNVAAEEIAEPYRLLVVHDFPEQFDKSTTVGLLQRIMENGPRCGVHTVVSARMQDADAYTPGIEDLQRSETLFYGSLPPVWCETPENDSSSRLVLGAMGDELGEAEAARLVDQRIGIVGPLAQSTGVTTGLGKALDHYARAIESGTRSDLPKDAVVADLADPSTWWQNSSEKSIVAPLGLSAAREAAYLRLDSETRSSALLIGRPGSGKSTLIHTWLSALTTLYSPQELDLQLMDFKEGVEFSPYANQGLPHARAVAIESEREFGLNVLRSIEEEMRHRADLFKTMGNGVTSLEDYRRRSGKLLPRLVVVIDEFQVLFDQDDRIALDAATALEHIIRQGRGYGIHLVLGSQSLTGMIGLNKQVLQQIGTRILLPSSADDAALALGDRNDAHRHLTSRGQAVLNTEGGRPEANVFLSVAYEDDESRWARLIELRDRADTQGFVRRPVVFSSDRVADRAELTQAGAAARSSSSPRLVLGAPLGLGDPPSVGLDRAPGRNLLAILRDGSEAETAFTLGIIDDVLRTNAEAEIVLCPLVGIGQDFDPYLETLADLERVTVVPQRRLDEQLRALADDVEQRENAGIGAHGVPRILILHGAHRSRGLAESTSTGFSFEDPADEHDPASDLEVVLSRGPEVGVHVVAWADSLAGAARKLSRSALAAFDLRLAGALSPGDAGDYFDHGIAAPTKPRQALFMDRDSGRTEGVLLVTEVPLVWWREEVGRLAGSDQESEATDAENPEEETR